MTHNKKHFLLLFFSITIFYSSYSQSRIHRNPCKTADLIIFSFNRPMQLYALLETIHKYITNFNKIYLVYRTSNQAYESAYQEIKNSFSHIKFIKQGDNPRADFKPLLLECFKCSCAEYIFFAVDDDIVKDYFDVSECINAMENSGAYGFYLRVGKNITINYPSDGPIAVPPLTHIQNNIYRFRFKEGNDAWGYPHNLDMTIFKKSSIEPFFIDGYYSSPNTLESQWAGQADVNKFGLCFNVSKKFALPLNIVQQDWWTPNENSFSAEELLGKWQDGYTIDTSQFFKINNVSCIVKFKPAFIKRKNQQ